MKPPKCPKCGKGHFSTQRCSASIAAKVFNDAFERDTKAWDAVKPKGEEKVRIEKSATEFVDAVIKDALTPAEKQKAYRKRLKDDPKAHEAYLKANKLRMRAKRKNDG